MSDPKNNFFEKRFSSDKCDDLIPIALIEGNLPAACFLFNHNLSVNYLFEDNNGMTPLHHLVKCSTDNSTFLDILENELTKGIPLNIINKQDKNKNTAMHIGVYLKNYPAIELLEQYGADKSISNKGGYVVDEIVEDNDNESDKLNQTMDSIVKKFIINNSKNKDETETTIDVNFHVSDSIPFKNDDNSISEPNDLLRNFYDVATKEKRVKTLKVSYNQTGGKDQSDSLTSEDSFSDVESMSIQANKSIVDLKGKIKVELEKYMKFHKSLNKRVSAAEIDEYLDQAIDKKFKDYNEIDKLTIKLNVLEKKSNDIDKDMYVPKKKTQL